jgi:catechol 2,3-dioxygenase-like lactoylglutathione lyase family enzyme
MRESGRFNSLIPELYCSDFERSFDFYTRIAGFTLLYKGKTIDVRSLSAKALSS